MPSAKKQRAKNKKYYEQNKSEILPNEKQRYRENSGQKELHPVLHRKLAIMQTLITKELHQKLAMMQTLITKEQHLNLAMMQTLITKEQHLNLAMI